MGRNGQSIALVGVGNIGSHLVGHLGRMPGVAKVLIVDRDVYETGNLSSQDITPEDVGRSKADAQAERLRRLNPALDVRAIHDSIANVPLGLLRCDVILAALDSRRARLYVNQAAWRLGVPWIDSGVETGGLLARVNVYMPGDGSPCYECGWDERDYELVEQEYPCAGAKGQPAPTGGISSLGALAAAMQAIECRKLLRRELGPRAAGRQVLVDLLHHKHYVTALTRNPGCRFDHETLSIERLHRPPGIVTLGEALALVNGPRPGPGGPAIGVEGKAFVRTLGCPHCGHASDVFCLEGRVPPGKDRCGQCGEPMIAAAFDMLEEIDRKAAGGRLLSGTLRSIGLMPHDIVRVRHGFGESFYELGGQ